METLWMLVICSIVSYSFNLKVYMSNSYGSFVTLFKMLCCHVNFVFLFSLFISNSIEIIKFWCCSSNLYFRCCIK